MRHFLAGLVILLVIGLLLVWGLNQLSTAAARQSYAEAARAEAYGRAEAMVIHAQAESRLSAAQAAATTSSAMLPWGVLGVLGLLGLAVVALAFQGCSVLRYTDIVEDIIQVHTVFEKLKADIFDLVFA